jgi:hypothetical protein
MPLRKDKFEKLKKMLGKKEINFQLRCVENINGNFCPLNVIWHE